MNRLTLGCLLVLLGTGAVHAQEDSKAWKGLVDRIQREPGKAPPLSEIFADLATLVDRVDVESAAVLVERHDEIRDELAMLESFRSSLAERGLVIDIPEELNRGLDFQATEEILREAEAELADLKTKYRLEKERADVRRRMRPVPPTLAEARQGSQAAEAALAIDLELPEPPRSESAEEVATTASEALDTEGMARALYAQGDYEMALRAWERLPEEKLSTDIHYYMARCRDLLGRWKEAEKGYEHVLATAPESYWAENAKWMLDFGRQKQRIKKLIDDPKANGATVR